jgi:hypothetical protein
MPLHYKSASSEADYKSVSEAGWGWSSLNVRIHTISVKRTVSFASLWMKEICNRPVLQLDRLATVIRPKNGRRNKYKSQEFFL